MLQTLADDRKKALFLTGLAAAGTTILATEIPAQATPNASVTAVNGLVTDVGTVVTGAIAVVLSVVGIRVAVKTFNRIFVKN